MPRHCSFFRCNLLCWELVIVMASPFSWSYVERKRLGCSQKVVNNKWRNRTYWKDNKEYKATRRISNKPFEIVPRPIDSLWRYLFYNSRWIGDMGSWWFGSNRMLYISNLINDGELFCNMISAWSTIHSVLY